MNVQEIDKKLSKAVALVSQSQIYQKNILIFFCLIWSHIGLSTLIVSMVFTNPLLHCNGTSSTQANYCQNIGEQNSDCQYENNFTGTYQAGLYCQNRQIRMTLQSIFAFGAIIGIIFMPGLSDLKGKYPCTNLSLICCIFGNVLICFGIFYRQYFAIGLGLFLVAIGVSALIVITYSINSDFLSDNLRQKYIIYYCAAWGFSDMSVIIVYYLVPYWWFYMIFLLLVPICCLYMYFISFFLQSLHYLINGKSDFSAAKTILEKLAKINNASAQDLKKSHQIIELIQNCQAQTAALQQQLTAGQSLKLILHTPKYLKAVICLILTKMGFYCFYYGLLGCLERTGFNFGISVFLLGFGEFFGHATGTLFIPQLRRKLVMGVNNTMVSIMGLAYITRTVQQSPFIGSIILLLVVTMLSYSFSALTLIQTESFQSTIRSTALGIEYGASYLVRLGLPFMIGYLNERGIHPIIATSVIMVFIGIVPILFLDETYGYSNLQHEHLLTNHQQQIQLKVTNSQINCKNN